MTAIDIKGLDRAAVLTALFNHTKPFGMGAWDPLADTKLTVEEAQQILDTVKPRSITDLPVPGQMYTETDGQMCTGRYLRGHSLDLVFGRDTVEVRQYELDNGAGLAERAISRLRETGEVTAA